MGVDVGFKRHTMHNVKKYSPALLRERLADTLDEADRGVPVVVERRGVRYTLAADAHRNTRKTKRSRIEILDPAVADGQWTWDWSPEGLKLNARRRR